MGYILGVGGANFDISIRSKQNIVLKDSNPGYLTMSPGGVTRNILANLSKLNLNCSLISAVGKDAFGDAILKSCEDLDIKTDGIYTSSEHSSSSYVDILGPDGDMFVASCDAAIIENMPHSWLEDNKNLIQNAELIVCDGNLTEAQLTLLVKLADGIPIFCDPVSTAKAQRVKAVYPHFEMIKPNGIELEALTGISCDTNSGIEKASEFMLSKGLKRIAVSLGKEGAYYADKYGNSFYQSSEKIIEMENASGAGDAFMAGFIYGFVKKLDPENILRCAQSAGGFAVTSKETINTDLNEEIIRKAIK